MWLIRDATLKVRDKNGQPITPTEYLKTVVLVRRGSKESDQNCVIDSINTLFPSIECHTLPRPSVEPSIINSIVTSESQLDGEFARQLCTFRELVLGKLVAKMTSDQQCKNGLVVSELLTSYVNLVNSGLKISLQDTYAIAVEGILLSRLQVLTSEYQQEMEQLLQGRYPMEEEITLNVQDQQQNVSLMAIHRMVMKHKKDQFKQELDNFLPAESSMAISESLMSRFVDDICRKTRNGEVVTIEGGKLCKFVSDNWAASDRFCENLSLKVFRDITDKIERATTTRNPVDLSDELLLAERQYYDEAVGPAKDEVYAKKREEFSRDCKNVSLIPRRPFSLRVSGRDKDRVKLQWEGTGDDYAYEVQYMSDRTNWMTSPDKYQQQSAIVKSLEARSDYIFRVRATSETRGHGNWSDSVSTNTTMGFFQRGAATVGTFLGGTVASPALLFSAMPIGGPLSAVAGLVTAPIVGAVLAKRVAKHYGPTGDFTDSESNENVLLTEVGSIQAADGEECEGEEDLVEAKEQ